jgi:hypothetical protein
VSVAGLVLPERGTNCPAACPHTSDVAHISHRAILARLRAIA